MPTLQEIKENHKQLNRAANYAFFNNIEGYVLYSTYIIIIIIVITVIPYCFIGVQVRNDNHGFSESEDHYPISKGKRGMPEDTNPGMKAGSGQKERQWFQS